MKIWYDACTGKHVRYGTAIARRLRRLGHEFIFTTREHPDTLALAKRIGEKPAVLGKYDPTSLSTRLEESAKRMLELAMMFKKDAPDLAICSQSVELCRVAFGLGIPIVMTADTPHATAVNRLTVPLAETLIISEAMPESVFKQYGAKRIIQFKGVDEVGWIKGYKPSANFDFEKPLIAVRQMETQAAYAAEKNDITLRLVRELTSLGNVLFLSRYDKPEIDGLIVTKHFLDSASLAACADLVVSVGGTLAREAALQGTPSIVVSEFKRIPVNDYLAKKGFPIFIVDSSEAIACARKHIGRKYDVKSKLAELENPVDVIEKIVEEKESD